MNFQTEISSREIARLLKTAALRGKQFSGYSGFLRWLLQDWLESQAIQAPKFSQEDAVEYLRSYGRFGLSIRQYGREDRKQERAEEIRPAAVTAGVLRSRRDLDAMLERLKQKGAGKDEEE